ncbi:MAG: flagellin [Selenomonadaceae bacterium]|nr:flagellin [Selenomonadaceae bacterium]
MAMTLGGVNPGLNQLNRISTATQKTSQILATGSNRPSASMGASEYAIAARLTSNIRGTSQSIQNTQNISSMFKIAEGATSNTIQALTTIKENLINAANDTNGSIDRQALQKNINQSIRQINLNAQTEYNGKRLLDGTHEDVTLAGIDGYENFHLGDLRAEALGLTDSEGNVTIDATNPDSIQQSLKTVGGALEYVTNLDGELEASLDGGISLEAALDQATTQGAQLQRMEYQEANYTTMEENQLSALSNMDDADMAKQITNLRNQQTQEQLAMFATRMFNQNRANVLSLLQ